MYDVDFLPEAIQDIKRIDKTAAQRVLKKLRWVAHNFESLQPEGLTGDLAGFFKIRVGDYRIIYTADQQRKALTVHLIGHRKDIYESR